MYLISTSFHDILLISFNYLHKPIQVINRNCDTLAIDSLTYHKIRHDLFPVLSRKDKFDLDVSKQTSKDYIRNLMQPSESELEYMDRFIAKEYRPDLLFENPLIVARIEQHPMALWKCQ